MTGVWREEADVVPAGGVGDVDGVLGDLSVSVLPAGWLPASRYRVGILSSHHQVQWAFTGS